MKETDCLPLFQFQDKTCNEEGEGAFVCLEFFFLVIIELFDGYSKDTIAEAGSCPWPPTQNRPEKHRRYR